MNIDDFFNIFNVYFVGNIGYKENSKEFTLEESGQYSFNVTQKEYGSLAIIKPSEIKNKAQYLK